ncbi:MAG: type IV pili methyl-accepting chemotaxis transducer N-terminal domain-containing protein [Pseudomonadota bacterium]
MDESTHFVELKRASARFSVVLSAQVNGSAELALHAEPDPDIRARLAALAKVWHPHGEAIQFYLAAPAVEEYALALNAFFSDSTRMANDLGDLSRAIVSAGGEVGIINPVLSNAINIAGRQRMLLQRMSKQICFVGTWIEPDLNKALLKGAAALFESTKAELYRTLENLEISASLRAEFARRTQRSNAIWLEFRKRIQKIIAADTYSPDNLAYVARNDDALLAALEAERALLVRLVVDEKAAPR